MGHIHRASTRICPNARDLSLQIRPQAEYIRFENVAQPGRFLAIKVCDLQSRNHLYNTICRADTRGSAR